MKRLTRNCAAIAISMGLMWPLPTAALGAPGDYHGDTAPSEKGVDYKLPPKEPIRSDRQPPVVTPGANPPACKVWRVDGEYKLTMSSGEIVDVTFVRTGRRVSGHAASGDLRGTIQGRMVDDMLSFGISWPAGTLRYSGLISPSGVIRGGSSWDGNNPGTAKSWRADKAHQCEQT